MNIDLELYRIFDSVVRTGSFSAAAKQMYISQPAVSQAIKSLESSFGAPLFIRSGRGVCPTREGEVLHGYIASALGLIGAGEARLKRLNTLAEGELRIGAGDTVSKWFLLPAVGRFHELYPHISLSMTNRTSRQILELLRAGAIDLGFVNMPLSSEDVIFEECMPLHDVFVAGSAFSHLRGSVLTPEEVCRLPLIMLERASNSRQWVDRHFLSLGAPLSPEIELGAHDLALDYARIGLGTACVVEEFARGAIESGDVFRLQLENEVPARSLAVCYMSGLTLSAAAQRFIVLAKHRAAELCKR